MSVNNVEQIKMDVGTSADGAVVTTAIGSSTVVTEGTSAYAVEEA